MRRSSLTKQMEPDRWLMSPLALNLAHLGPPWNLNLGRLAGLTVLPVSWPEHAFPSSANGPCPSSTVEKADLAVALFHDRLGTPTGEAESRTAEEIKVLVDARKSVAVLVNAGPRTPLSGRALNERQRHQIQSSEK